LGGRGWGENHHEKTRVFWIRKVSTKKFRLLRGGNKIGIWETFPYRVSASYPEKIILCREEEKSKVAVRKGASGEKNLRERVLYHRKRSTVTIPRGFPESSRKGRKAVT